MLAEQSIAMSAAIAHIGSRQRLTEPGLDLSQMLHFGDGFVQFANQRRIVRKIRDRALGVFVGARQKKRRNNPCVGTA